MFVQPITVLRDEYTLAFVVICHCLRFIFLKVDFNMNRIFDLRLVDERQRPSGLIIIKSDIY